MTDSVREKIIAKTLGLREKPEETIDDVAKEAEHMGVIDKTMDTARKLAGTNELSQQLNAERERGNRLEKEKDTATKQAHEAEIQNVRTELGGKIDHLAESMEAGASRKSLAEEINEIKKAANELGMGGSKVSEIKEIMSLISTLNPKTNLAEQVKEARDLLTTLQPAEDKGKGATVEGVPAEIALQIKTMDHNLQITLEQMKDDRQRRDQAFQLTLRKFDEDRLTRQEEIQMKYTIEKERNQMIGDGFKLVGRAAGKAYYEALGKGPQEAGVTDQPGAGKKYHIEIGEGESGTRECPYCKSPVGVGPTTQIAQCVGCNTKFPVRRVAQGGAPATSEETGEE